MGLMLSLSASLFPDAIKSFFCRLIAHLPDDCLFLNGKVSAATVNLFDLLLWQKYEEQMCSGVISPGQHPSRALHSDQETDCVFVCVHVWGGASQQLANSSVTARLQVVSSEALLKTSHSSLTLKDISSLEKRHFSC